MISLSIGNICLDDFITKIRFEISPYEVKSDSGGGGSGGSSDSRDYFLNYDGRKIYASYDAEEPDDDSDSDPDSSSEDEQETFRYFKTLIKCTLEGLPENKAAALSTILQNDTFTASYTSPALQSGVFLCTSYSAEPDEGSHEDGSTPDWNIDLVIETPEEEAPPPNSSDSSGSGAGSDSGSGL